MTLLIAGLVLAVGGVIQGVVGFGIALVGVPVVALIQPELVPGPMLMVASVHTVLSVIREHEHVDWRGVGWAMLGRVPGTVIGVIVIDSLPQRDFFLVVGLAVLAFTVLSMIAWRPRPTPGALTTAGLFSGAFGTAMSVGGPPVALLYQHETGPRVRSTLSAFFMLGTVLSAGSLAATGHLGTHELLLAALLAPFLVLGFVLSGPVRKIVEGGRIRYALLAFAAISAMALIGRSLLG
jgi:uncharacterized protein